jgi:hypothetical protein
MTLLRSSSYEGQAPQALQVFYLPKWGGGITIRIHKRHGFTRINTVDKKLNSPLKGMPNVKLSF